MDRVYILRGNIRKSSVVYGYYKSLNGARNALIRQEFSFGSKGFSNRYAAPLSDEEEARVLFEPTSGEYYGRLFIQSNELND